MSDAGTARSEALTDVGGVQLLTGLRSALAWLEANREQTNDLNVFPVPDGDTGSNMYLTLRSAVEEAQRAEDPQTAAAVMKAAAHGSLMGARGNSGVILSQIFRGFAQGIGEHRRVDAALLATALGEASAVAYKAVMKPTEGTVLTVVRDSAQAARTAAESSGDIRTVLEAAVAEAHAAVERTTDQLAVLREAGVVDAGGFGFAVILEGFARALADPDTAAAEAHRVDSSPRRGEPEVRTPSIRQGSAGERAPAVAERRGAAAVAEREEGWGYCTEFLIHGPGLDAEGLRGSLTEGTDAESALVVGDEDLVRVHIHTFDPAALIARAAQKGRLSRLKVEDMSAQHHAVLERAGAGEAPPEADPPRAQSPRVALAVVSVAPGMGFREILLGLGCAEVVEGGQTMNPSIEDLLTAVTGVNADAVVLLPNNGNVILTAQHVDELAVGVSVRVVPTRNVPQGISALLALDTLASVEANVARMTEASGAVHAVEVTRAVRDYNTGDLEVKSGDVIAIVDDRLTTVGTDDLTVVNEVLGGLSAPELVTVYRGAQVAEEDAAALVGALRAQHPAIEFELHNGGQEHYPYVLSVE